MIVFRNATVIDGLGGPPITDAVVVVRGDRIESVGLEPCGVSGADVTIDLKGKYLLPGFIDAHIHLGGTDGFVYPGIGNRVETYDYLKHRFDTLRWGVTTVRSAGDYTPDIFSFRDEVNAGLHVSPRIVAAGRMIQARGGHPVYTVFGGNEGIAAGACVMVDESTDVASEVKKLVDEGADWVKAVICEVNKLDYPARVPRLSGGVIKQVADTAHRLGKPCMIHVDNARHLREAAEAGADSIEHVFSVGASETDIDESLIEILVEKQIFVVPTVFSIKAHENPDGNMPLVYDVLLSQVGRLIRAGVKIGVGTDSSIPFVPVGESLHEELAQLVLCGMSPLEAILAATSGNAKLLGLDKDIGSVSPGFLADLVVVDGDPLSDISDTKKTCYVIMNGRIVVDKTKT